MPSTDTETAIDPPQGWINDEAHMVKGYYWSNEPNSLKHVLRTLYDLEDAKPIWTRHPKYGSVQFILQAKPTGKSPPNDDEKPSFYHWNGMEDTVAHFEEVTSLQKLKEDINAHGKGHGYLEDLKLKDLVCDFEDEDEDEE